MRVHHFLFTLLLMSQSGMLYAAKFIEPIMVNIPAGQLKMTKEKAESEPHVEDSMNTSDSHLVTLRPYRMGKYEVTVEEFTHFIAATNYAAPDTCTQMNSKEWFAETPASWKKNKHSVSAFEPVTCVGWNAAQAYVEWLAEITGKKYRLPSEAEWEYAARAGTTTTYYWGNDPEQACTFANIADRAAEAAIKRDYDGLESKDHVGVVPCDDRAGYASIVGMYKPNAFGLHDMIGNINEFTQDCFNESYAGGPTDGNARLDGNCADRVVRGGSWHWGVFPASGRMAWNTSFVGSLEGFRVVEEMSDNHPCRDPSSSLCKKLSTPDKFARNLLRAQKAEWKRRRMN